LDLLKRKYTLIAGKAVEMIFGNGSWETYNDLKNIYWKIFGIPQVMIHTA
jgi:hypothetical protein